jgi:hypothetical protein
LNDCALVFNQNHINKSQENIVLSIMDNNEMNTADDGGSKADANKGGASDVGAVTIKMPNNDNGGELLIGPPITKGKTYYMLT